MVSKLDLRDRTALFQTAERDTYDVLVIGGGITGAGTARDAAMRGLKVALVDARDFAAGTSSRSSKMVHGGLRYLAQGHVGLVKEAAQEKHILRQIAPHLAQVEPFVVPYPSLAASAKFKAGLTLFEQLGKVEKSERHKGWSKKDIQTHEPAMSLEGVAGAFVYHECLTDDARLTLANIRSAKEHGADVLSYARVTKLVVENGRAVGAAVKGQLPSEEIEAVIKARCIVNAAGPWVDSIMRLEDDAHQDKLQLTKGIHLVCKHARLPVNRTIIMTTPDKRSVFAVPRDGFTYIGTTDTFYSSADYWPEVDAESVDYLLEACASAFTVDPIQRSELEAIWSGVRPLIAQVGKSASEISREDELWTGPHGVLSIAGGKLSAYRKMAERIVDQLHQELGKRMVPSSTADEPLPGGSQSVAMLEQTQNLSDVSVDQRSRLIRLYGDEVTSVLDAGGDMRAEIHHGVTHEGTLRLEDYWSRRSSRAWFSDKGGMNDLEAAANEMGTLMGWSSQRKQQEIGDCRKSHEDALAV